MDKSFEALYKTAMAMANSCIGNTNMEKRYEKLQEEFKELSEVIEPYLKAGTADDWKAIEDEFGDVLFVLLHFANMMGYSPFRLLHNATSKMLSRMNDPNYIAKN